MHREGCYVWQILEGFDINRMLHDNQLVGKGVFPPIILFLATKPMMPIAWNFQRGWLCWNLRFWRSVDTLICDRATSLVICSHGHMCMHEDRNSRYNTLFLGPLPHAHSLRHVTCRAAVPQPLCRITSAAPPCLEVAAVPHHLRHHCCRAGCLGLITARFCL